MNEIMQNIPIVGREPTWNILQVVSKDSWRKHTVRYAQDTIIVLANNRWKCYVMWQLAFYHVRSRAFTSLAALWSEVQRASNFHEQFSSPFLPDVIQCGLPL